MARLLYVEDYRDIRRMTTMAFEAAGHEVTACADYKQAQQALKRSRDEKKPFDLIVTDGQYPGDGVRFKTGSHQDYEGSACLLHDHKLLGLKTPVIVMSGMADYLVQNPYPAQCSRPNHILHKTDYGPTRLMSALPGFIAEGITPSG